MGLVFFAHSGLEHLIPGGLGVTVFFVLSGYLITTLMRMEHARTGGIDFRSFYLRRVVRLMPPLAIVVAATALLAHFDLIAGDFSLMGLLSVLFYFGNYFVIDSNFADVPLGIGVTWSLAVEEHYYLLYPPLAALLLRIGRVRFSATVLLGMCAAVLAWRYWLLFNGASENYLTMATDTRVDAILVGCLLALLRNPRLDPLPAPRPVVEWGLMVFCLGLLLGTLLYRDEVFRLTTRYTLQSLAIAPLIYLAVARSQAWPFRWLNSRPMVYLGTVSYTIYLSHQVILYMVQHHWPQAGWAITTAATAALTLTAAALMRRYVEVPSARLRKRLHGKPRPIAAHAPGAFEPAPPVSAGRSAP